MKLQALAAKPQLTKITINDEKIVEKYGETLEFYVYDRHNMDLYLKLAAMSGSEDPAELFRLFEDLIYDENGTKILEDNQLLPTDIMVKVIEETLKNLGNLSSRILEE
jgi:hypothetical protein